MGKPLGFLSCGMVLFALAVADAWILTHEATLSRLADAEIRAAAGQALTFTGVRATLTGGIELKNLGLQLTSRKVNVLSADTAHAWLSRRAGRWVVDYLQLDAPRLNFSKLLLDELSAAGPSRSIRELIPAEALPRIVCRGGTLEVVHPDVLAWDRSLVMTIEDLALVPSTQYRYFIGGRLRSPLLGSWRLTGEVDLETGDHSLHLRSEGIVLGPELRSIFAPRILPHIDRYQPEGPVEVSVDVTRDLASGSPDVKFQATVRPRGLKLRFKGFPYPVQDVTGEIEFRQDGFTVKKLEGRGPPGSHVRFDGQSGGYAAETPHAFWLEMTGVPVDETLLASLPPKAQETARRFSPAGGLMDARVRIVKDRGATERERVAVDLAVRETSLRYDRFPYPLERASGELRIEGGDAVIKLFRGFHGTAEVRVAGAVRGTAEDASVDLYVDAESVELTPALRTAMPENVRKIWNRFEPGGTVDCTVRVLKNPGEKERFRVTVRPKGGNRLVYADIPLPATLKEGVIEYDEGLVLLNHVKGDLDVSGHVEINAQLRPTEKGYHNHYEIDGRSVIVDDRFKRAMPKELSSLLTSLRISGEADFKLTYTDRLEGQKPEKLVYLALRLRKGVIATNVRFEDIEATINLSGSYADGVWKMNGPILFHECRIHRKKVTNLSTSLLLNGTVLSFNQIRADAYGGQITGQIRYDIQTDELSYGNFVVDRLNLREFVMDTDKWSDRKLSGTVRLEIADLKGRATETESLTGTGSIRITDGQLLGVPGIVSFLDPSSFGDDRKFAAMKSEFAIEKRRFEMAEFAFLGTEGTGGVYGKGWLDFDGKFSVRVNTETGALFGLPFLPFKLPGAIFDIFKKPFRTKIEGDLESANPVK